MLWWAEIKDLKRQLSDVENELRKEQGAAVRLAGFLSRLQRFGISPTGQVPRREFGAALLDSLSELLKIDQAILFLTDPATQDLLPMAARGVPPDILARQRIRLGEGTMGNAALHHAPTLYQNAASAESLFFGAPALILPLRSKGHCSGLLVLAKPQEGSFSAGAQETAALMAMQAALTLENYAHYEDAARLCEQTVTALTKTIEAKDLVTHTHSCRTRGLVRAFAQEIPLPEALIKEIEYGASLHDVGKIGIDEAILGKPGKLTVQEYNVVKTHPAIGYRIVQPIPFLRQAAAIVLYHQEWYNGAGYPEGLAGEEIPFGARLVQIIDAWDAMTSDRPYRKALPKTTAIAELRRQEGTQFDPKLVEIFLRVIDRLEREGIPTTEQQKSLIVNGK